MSCPRLDPVGVRSRRVEIGWPPSWAVRIVGTLALAAVFAPSLASGQTLFERGRLLQPRMATYALPDAAGGDRILGPADGPDGIGQGTQSPLETLDIAPVEGDSLPGHARRLPFSGFFRLPEERFRGPGEPLIQESWQFRPYSVGGFYGFVQGGAVIRDWVYEEQGVLSGATFGWDFHHYFGFDMRLAFGRVALGDTLLAIEAQRAADDAAGLGPDDPARRRFDSGRANDLFLLEFDVQYYPWGDSRWRPYVTLGFGVTSVDFIDRFTTVYQDAYFTLPFGIGVKYLQSDCLNFRLEFVDHMAVAGGTPIETMHHLTLTAGFEYRFGGSRRAYWPWNPGRHYW